MDDFISRLHADEFDVIYYFAKETHLIVYFGLLLIFLLLSLSGHYVMLSLTFITEVKRKLAKIELFGWKISFYEHTRCLLLCSAICSTYLA
jgi:hypothetical protein